MGISVALTKRIKKKKACMASKLLWLLLSRQEIFLPNQENKGLRAPKPDSSDIFLK